MEGLDNEDVLRRYQNFSKFDTVVDHSYHFFSSKRYEMNQVVQCLARVSIFSSVYLVNMFVIDMIQQSKEWVDKIHDEWRMLAENLPGICLLIHLETLVLF